jgi:hypothetical protein
LMRLTQCGPANMGFQRDLSIAHNLLSSVFKAQGRLGDALREAEAGKQMLMRLTQLDPENADWQQDLAAAHNSVASVLEEDGEPERALREYEKSLAIAKNLAVLDPTNIPFLFTGPKRLNLSKLWLLAKQESRFVIDTRVKSA